MKAPLLEVLACPCDHMPLTSREGALVCPEGHSYPVIEGVPVMLRQDREAIHPAFASTLAAVKAGTRSDDRKSRLYLEGLYLTEKEMARLEASLERESEIDPVASYLVAATCGNLYKGLIGSLTRYPIPEMRLPPGAGKRLLDVGCSWGRWCIAAAQKGYRAVGIDPCLASVLAARRVAAQLGVEAEFIVADARFLPFAPSTFDVAFSYSVIQHFSKPNARIALAEVARTLRPHGRCLIQMAGRYGIRSMWHQLRRIGRKGPEHRVRYWGPLELKKTFTDIVGQTRMSVDGYFGLGIQRSDIDLMPAHYRLVIRASEVLRAVSRALPPIVYVADSLYLDSVKEPARP
jgi:SAM-dependent methyltransferase/uncharacterized protein YbaR (Trm112 family)